MRTSGACSALNFALVLGPSFIKNGHTLLVLSCVCSVAPGELVTVTVAGCPGSDDGGGGVGAGWAAWVCGDVDDAAPALLLALTVARSVCPSSEALSVYVLAVAPAIAAQPAPPASQ